jgi:hypothetical protein
MEVRLSIRVAVAATALLAATTGCASDDQESATSPAAPTQAPSPAGSLPAEPTAAAPAPSAAAPAPSAGGTSVPLLEGAVGTEEDPESFELTLTDSSGAPVETLPAGAYDIRVKDVATIHNFHLTGPGVDETTPIPGTTEVVWRVTLTAGEYTAVCDPHPDMAASFTVS